MSHLETPSQPHPEGTPEFVSARARRRRYCDAPNSPQTKGRAELFAHLVRRAFPRMSYACFFICGRRILGLGYLFNAQALLIFGIPVAPSC